MTVAGAQLHGLVTDVQVFKRQISAEEALGYTTCSKTLRGDLGSWENEEQWETFGFVTTTSVDINSICHEDGSLERKAIAFPAWHTYDGKFGKK